MSGNKQELVERLQSAVDTALLDENDDDLDQVLFIVNGVDVSCDIC